jgi:hypothetical protein
MRLWPWRLSSLLMMMSRKGQNRGPECYLVEEAEAWKKESEKDNIGN